jgi:hypothetical protein
VVRQNPGRGETVDFPRPRVPHSPAMILTIIRLLSLIPTALKQRSELALKNLALRQQLAIFNRLQWLRRSTTENRRAT